jgi:hypothetical protein
MGKMNYSDEPKGFYLAMVRTLSRMADIFAFPDDKRNLGDLLNTLIDNYEKMQGAPEWKDQSGIKKDISQIERDIDSIFGKYDWMKEVA